MLLALVCDQYAAAGALLAALVPGLVLLWDTGRNDARIVRVRRRG
jgi:hypothetical protein